MTIISEKEPADPELLWAQLSEAAASNFNGGRFAAAAEGWKNAHAVAQDFDEYDPRLAAGLNNLAITFRIKQNFEETEKFYRRAMDGWEAASQWVDGMRLEQRARSSLFHLRLERKHREQYDRVARKKYQKLLLAGRAGILNNLAELFHSTNRFKEAEQFYHQAFQQRISSMGDQERGATVIRKNIACLSDAAAPQPDATDNSHRQSSAAALFMSQAERHRWIVDRPAEFTDEGRLMAAILLTHLLDHRYLRNANL